MAEAKTIECPRHGEVQVVAVSYSEEGKTMASTYVCGLCYQATLARLVTEEMNT